MNYYANPRKTRSVRELGAVDISGIRDDILAIPDGVWAGQNAHKPNRSQALNVTEHVMFRFISEPTDWRESYDFPIWAEWRERLEPVMQQATAPYAYARGGFPRIMLARMPAGGKILPHIDENRSAAWPHKIHVPIKTSPEVEFYVDPDVHHLAEGHAYEVNNRGVHAVSNLGREPRIHLIFEYYDLDQPVEAW